MIEACTVTNASRAGVADGNREILVEDPLADSLNPVEPGIALVASLEARRDVKRHRELQALRRVQPTVVLHEDDCAVIGAKRLPDVKRSRSLGTQDRPVRGGGSQQLPGSRPAAGLGVGRYGRLAHAADG